ncbi:hypothetical protein [Pseudonocardia adelaidensis]|uniref:Uncharacterized protein n=1 Tax=Pseudonocardia adelaidensis TaxID=648754 RepID=A0ABP9NPT0_9PSEU
MPTPGSPTTATPRPARNAATTVSRGPRQAADRAGEGSSGSAGATRNTSPLGTGRGRAPRERACIRAAVWPAAIWASASSRVSACRDHVVRLTLPSSLPVAGSATGTAAHV